MNNCVDVTFSCSANLSYHIFILIHAVVESPAQLSGRKGDRPASATRSSRKYEQYAEGAKNMHFCDLDDLFSSSF